jgi:hypothetical protein
MRSSLKNFIGPFDTDFLVIEHGGSFPPDLRVEKKQVQETLVADYE